MFYSIKILWCKTLSEGVFGNFGEKNLKKDWKKFGANRFFVVPLQPQTGKTGVKPRERPVGETRTEVIEMIATDKGNSERQGKETKPSPRHDSLYTRKIKR